MRMPKRVRLRERLRVLVADPRFLDAAVTLGCFALSVLAVKGMWSVLPRPAIAIVGALGSAAQWPRRRWPRLAALAGAGSAVSGNPVPLVVGLYSGAAYGPRRQVWYLALAGWAGLVGWSWFAAGNVTFQDVAASACVAALVVAVGIYTATRRDLMASLWDRAERAEAERLLREEHARAAERTRIAREMHDVLAHKVSLIALHAGALELHAASDPSRATQGAALIRVTAREALQELRTVLGVLQAGPGEPAQGIDWPDPACLVEASTRAGQQVDLRDNAGELPLPTARVVYRVVQEGLTNARKHAPGATTIVSIERGADDTVTVTVTNTGTSAAPLGLPGSDAGLVGLAERIRLVGGTLHSGPIGPHGRDGWQLQARVPWTDTTLDNPAEGPMRDSRAARG
jgi:signal transduction histidine kinase